MAFSTIQGRVSETATDDTFTLAYPAGKTAASYRPTGARLAIRDLQNVLEQGNSTFTVDYGVSGITVTYKDDTTIPQGSVVILEAQLYGTGGALSSDNPQAPIDDLTEDGGNVGGTNDGDMPDLDATAPAITDSTTGTPDTSAPIALEAITTPTAVVDLTTGTPDTSGERDLEAVTNPDLASWDGASVYPSAAQATAIGAAITALKNNQATQSDQNDAIVGAIVALKNNQATQSDGYDAILADNVALRAAVRELAAKVNAILAADRVEGEIEA